MIKKLSYLLILAAVCTIAGCAASNPVTVKTDSDQSARFGQYHTYVIDNRDIGVNPTYAAALEKTLDDALAARGLRKATGGKADLYIVPIVLTRGKIDRVPTGDVTVTRSGFGRYGWKGSAVTLNTQNVEYREGSLVVDFVDSQQHKIVFRGLAQAAVSSSQERNAAAMKEAVSKIMAAYP
jgi:Domain of unknown function (DUF4136)